MKKIYLLILALTGFHFVKASNPVPNFSFENWTSGNPVGWSTDNDPEWITVTQFQPGYVGSYAAKGQASVFSTDTFPPLLSSSLALGGVGFDITQAYNNLEFYYKSNLVGGDKFIALVTISDSNQNVIGTGWDTISTNASGFTVMEANITYTGSTPAATAVIYFEITGNHLASYFIVDDVSLNLVTGVNEQPHVINSYALFPNPVSDNLNLDVNLSYSQKVEVQLFNCLGSRVNVAAIYDSNPGDNRYKIDVQHLPQGIYFARIMMDGVLTSTRQFIVSR